ncbi:MAG: helix-turn-helix transcriptional regulator [Planctomycetota bacterium]|nr:helix-turn-helix transcriptional regulator [Planctomycetota bacterium]
METVTDQLRQAVEQCGQTRYAISKATGIPASVLSRFVASGRGLRSENFDKLCTHLGLVLTEAPAKSMKTNSSKTNSSKTNAGKPRKER